MTDHLPECAERRAEWRWSEDCICPALRACEQRVLEQNARAFDVAVIKHLLQEERAAGLDAAREAVAAIRHAPDCRALCPCCMGDYDCNCERYEALTAIDALRGEQP